MKKKRKVRNGYKLMRCPVCKSETFEYTSMSEYGIGTVEEHGNCSRCGYVVEQAYSPVYEAFRDVHRGYRTSSGKYVPKNIRKHKRIRRKFNVKGIEINPEWVFLV